MQKYVSDGREGEHRRSHLFSFLLGVGRGEAELVLFAVALV